MISLKDKISEQEKSLLDLKSNITTIQKLNEKAIQSYKTNLTSIKKKYQQ